MSFDFNPPQLEWVLLLPYMIVLGSAVLSVLAVAFAPRRFRWPLQVVFGFAGLLGGLISVGYLWSQPTQYLGLTYPMFGQAVPGVGTTKIPVSNQGQLDMGDIALGSLLLDRQSLFFMSILLIMAIVAMFTMIERNVDGGQFASSAAAVPGSDYEVAAKRAGLSSAEVFSLVLFAIGGMMVFVSAGDLLTLFVALEVFSLPLYIMTGIAARRRRVSQEAAMKYFILGAFSSAIMLFGIALLFAVTGNLELYRMPGIPRIDAPAYLVIAVLMICVGLLFKVGAVPFHSWTPDVYEGAPTSITGFMAACTKIAAFAALIRVLWSLQNFDNIWQPMIAVVAAATMIVGVVVGVLQTNVKRILAYSSIAHAGFMLTALVAVGPESVSSVMFYLFAYAFTTIGAFAVVQMVRETAGEGTMIGEAPELSQWNGLSQRSPLLAAVFTIFLLAMAGLPLTSGFIGKFAVFRVAIGAGFWWLAVIGVLSSAVAVYFYVKIIRAMYFEQPADGVAVTTTQTPMAFVAVAVGLVATIALGVVPNPILETTQKAAEASVLLVLNPTP